MKPDQAQDFGPGAPYRMGQARIRGVALQAGEKTVAVTAFPSLGDAYASERFVS
jgi:hypothetical protein